MNKDFFEKKIMPVLQYVGLIGAIVMAIAYILIVIVMILGFKIDNILETTIFGIVNAVVGLMITQFLKIQGQSFAENLPENKKITDQYYRKKTKDKKLHSMTYYWVTSVIKDIFTKGLTLAASTVGVIYIVVSGSKDFTLLGMAAVNLLMFVSFGLLAMNKAYEFYNNYHIPFVVDKLLAAGAVVEKTEGVKDDSL